MRKYLILFVSLLICTFLSAQKNVVGYGIGFYNLENLFDTERDEEINDEDFTPSGDNAWTLPKYNKKLKNMASVINLLGRDYVPSGVSILGVSEVENRKVLEDLVNTPPLKKQGFKIVHYDSPDKRGIDVGLLYNPHVFKVTASATYPCIFPNEPDYKTRDQLLVSGILAGEPIHVIVNHWPSRRSTSKYREIAAAVTKHITDSLYAMDENAKIIIMGDLNDNPTDPSVKDVIKAKQKQSEVEKGGFYNTMWDHYAYGIGSLGYQGEWSLFDQIIISEPLLGEDRSTLKFKMSEIFNRDFLIEKKGRNKGYPLRTFRGSVFINGYSDHFPTLIYLVKELD